MEINEKGIIDLHTHSTLSDGTLSLIGLTKLAIRNGYSVLGITDHVFHYNYKSIAPKIIEFVENNQHRYKDILLVPGVEITFASRKQMEAITKYVRSIGTKLVVVHGEGSLDGTGHDTNNSAIDNCVDILAHPGTITDNQAQKAANNNVAFELSARDCYRYSNKDIAEKAFRHGANLVINSDGHYESAMLTEEKILGVAKNANLTKEQLQNIKDSTVNLVKRLLSN